MSLALRHCIISSFCFAWKCMSHLLVEGELWLKCTVSFYKCKAQNKMCLFLFSPIFHFDIVFFLYSLHCWVFVYPSCLSKLHFSFFFSTTILFSAFVKEGRRIIFHKISNFFNDEQSTQDFISGISFLFKSLISRKKGRFSHFTFFLNKHIVPYLVHDFTLHQCIQV